jgi:Domain of unknown function (DUF4158)
VASIDCTACPRFKRRPSTQELTEISRPSAETLVFIRDHTRGPSPTLTVAVLLKSMQRLGYLPACGCAVRGGRAHSLCLRVPPTTALDVGTRTLHRHHAAIRDFLQVRAWGPEARHIAISAVHAPAAVQDHPADLINVAIEELVRRCPPSADSTGSSNVSALSSTRACSNLWWAAARMTMSSCSTGYFMPSRASAASLMQSNSHRRGHRCHTQAEHDDGLVFWG